MGLSLLCLTLSVYCFSKSSYKADSDYITASVTGPDTLCIGVGGAIARSEVTCLGVYLPVVAEAGQSSIVTVSFRVDVGFICVSCPTQHYSYAPVICNHCSLTYGEGRRL